MTTIIAIYGAVLSTITFAYSLWKKRDAVKILYSMSDINNKYYWSFEVINVSQRSIYIKDFWFKNGDNSNVVLKNCEDLDDIDVSETLELSPNRSVEIIYSEKILEMNKINPRNFFVEEENGKKYFLDESYHGKKFFDFIKKK
ncbi:MAG: hypothetical protein PHW24_01030 [Candidatus Moranbacteria bacterium]|nr:hypothetical protein [Candidatus Moranbacteria bacterium]